MRLKIIAGNLLAVLMIGLISFLVVRSQLKGELVQAIDSQLPNDSTLFARSFQLSGRQFVEHVADRASTAPVTAAFLGLDRNSRRTRAHEACNQVAQWFRDPTRGRLGPPDIVVITDETGRVIARNQDPNRMHGNHLGQQLPVLRRVLKAGGAQHDVWKRAEENKLLQTGAAAIRSEAGAIIGALVVGYDLSNGFAQRESKILGRDVAFLTDGDVYSSSLTSTDGLRNYFFEKFGEQSNAALQGKASTPLQAQIGDNEWVGVVAPLPMSPSVPMAYAVMANRTERLALADTANIILILTALGVLLVLVYGFIIGTGFLRPVEQIEEGVLAVINGRTDLRLDIASAEFGGLAYRINQLINVFTGVAEEDEEGRVSGLPGAPSGEAWKDTAFNEAAQASRRASTSEGNGSATEAAAAKGGGGDVIDDPGLAQQLSSQPEEQYYARVYQEYVAAKTALGENVGNIPQDRFVQRLQGNASALAKKHGCRSVRFQVERRGNQVVLKPVLIR